MRVRRESLPCVAGKRYDTTQLQGNVITWTSSVDGVSALDGFRAVRVISAFVHWSWVAESIECDDRFALGVWRSGWHMLQMEKAETKNEVVAKWWRLTCRGVTALPISEEPFFFLSQATHRLCCEERRE
jgi:hypothetical protein